MINQLNGSTQVLVRHSACFCDVWFQKHLREICVTRFKILMTWC